MSRILLKYLNQPPPQLDQELEPNSSRDRKTSKPGGEKVAKFWEIAETANFINLSTILLI